MTSKTKISEEKLEEAKRMYMEYKPIKVIAEQLGVPRTTVQYHANQYWETERELAKNELFRQFTSLKKATLTKLSEASLKIMTRALENAASSDEPPTLREAQQTSLILEAIDKILRLDDGKPTDITESKPVTTIELKKRLSADPFAEIIDAEVKELDHKGESHE